jgi:hypothetical protein
MSRYPDRGNGSRLNLQSNRKAGMILESIMHPGNGPWKVTRRTGGQGVPVFVEGIDVEVPIERFGVSFSTPHVAQNPKVDFLVDVRVNAANFHGTLGHTLASDLAQLRSRCGTAREK